MYGVILLPFSTGVFVALKTVGRLVNYWLQWVCVYAIVHPKPALQSVACPLYQQRKNYNAVQLFFVSVSLGAVSNSEFTPATFRFQERVVPLPSRKKRYMSGLPFILQILVRRTVL